MRESNFKYERILVPLDGSDLAEQALAPAVEIAMAMSAEIMCLQVVTGLSIDLDPYLNKRVIKAREQAANLHLNSLQDRFSKYDVTINALTTVGPAAKTIVKYAKERAIDLIIMSSHGQTGLKRWAYGNVAIKILRRAPCDTLMVRPLVETESFSKSRVLVPLDGSRQAERALKPAVTLASAWDMEILLLRVSPPVHMGFEPMGSRSMFDDIEKQAREEAKAYLHDFRASLARLHKSVTVKTITGTPAATILDYSKKQNVDMIIMSSHGRTGVGLWLMGSVSEKCCERLVAPP
jgi:nucleotide-binding universal stress UspA family protein